MGKWSAADFLKDFDFDDGLSEVTDNFIEFKKDKFKNFNDGDIVEEEAIPAFEITYSEGSGFGVYSCKDKDNETFSIKGSFPKPLSIGKTYLIKGRIESYNSNQGKEKQLVVDRIESIMPTSKDGIIEYLQTLKGLKSRAYSIYDIYEDESLKMLKEKPLEVASKIIGISEKSALTWQKELIEIEENEAELVYLMDIGLKPYQANILLQKYEEKVIEKIKENPYILSRELERFGFIKADEIARNMGYEFNNFHRVQEGIVYALNTATNEGHCYLPRKELIEKASELLNVYLSVNEMNKFAREHNSDFKYSLNKRHLTIDYNEMINLLNGHGSSKWRNQSLRYKIHEASVKDIEEGISALTLEGRLITDSNKVYLEHYYQAELEVVSHVNRIVDSKESINWGVEDNLKSYCKEKKIKLEKEQEKAVIMFASSIGGLHILNGSAGTGKTFTLKVIVGMIKDMYKELGKDCSVLLLAPTGKASKVAKKATGMECKTIHRGLKYNPAQGFEHNYNNPIEEDIIIVDETSMLDILLAKNLLSAVKLGAKVIFLGDTKQLPSVGPGNVLSDLINSNKVDIVTLTVPKRQEIKSGVIENANNIISGKTIENIDEDAYKILVRDVQSAREEIISLFHRIGKFKGCSFDDIQLLCPQRIGSIGTDYMNYLLQEEFNKNSKGAKVLNKSIYLDNNQRVNLFFKEGDKVIHTKNNYDMEWYKKTQLGYSLMGDDFLGITNGECGIISEIIEEKEKGKIKTKVTVKYDDMYIIYEDGMEELDHAYALTIHKYQGSQSPAIIMLIMMANYIMLDNNLFYTGYTRAENFITIVGEERAIKHAIKTQRSKHRYTTLEKLL